MPIGQRRITDRDSFLTATSSPRDTAALYFYKQLDPYLESALSVSMDFFARPQLYTSVVDSNEVSVETGAGTGTPVSADTPRQRTRRAGGTAKSEADAGRTEVVQLLARLRSRCGSDELLPSRSQRQDMYTPVFGAPGDSANFGKLRDDLIAAATAFAERVFDTGEEMLRERVRTAHRPLQDYLVGLTGASTGWTARSALDTIAESTSFRILRNPSICAVFGIGSTPQLTWPYGADSNADKLLEEIAGKIDPASGLTRQQASNRQRLAARGAEAISAVIDYSENSADPVDDIASLNILITQCYTWGAAKSALVI